MREDDIAENLREVAVVEDGNHGMDKHEDKLNQLHGCQILFPPKIFLHLWPHGRHEVVEIHDHMDAHVQEASKDRVPTTHKSSDPPSSEGHDTMVDNMEGGALIEFLPKDKEDSVKEVGEL